MTQRYTSLLALLTILAAGCGSSPGSDQEVFDFGDIAAAGPVIEPHPSGTSATLRVTTSIDAVCAVAFGETAALGMLATDQGMAGTGHADHEVVLGGLAPDTEYFYRLQGVGADGRLYRSELLTFRTPLATEALPGANVAQGATVLEVSSEFSDAFGAVNAIDGDPATEWSTAGDGDDGYLVIDLGRAVDVVAVGFHTRSMSDGTATTEAFTVTVDGDDIYGPFPVGRSDVSFTGQIIRFDVTTSTGGNTGAAEIEVFAGQ
ncbi:MAG: discoidin domain-containing protein [Acidimicrobiia bacterium]